MTDSLPGWNVWSFGYHSDDGNVYEGAATYSIGLGETFGYGETVGCGIDYMTGTYFFTLNGKIVGSFSLR